jgi:hypothetical protein
LAARRSRHWVTSQALQDAVEKVVFVSCHCLYSPSVQRTPPGVEKLTTRRWKTADECSLAGLRNVQGLEYPYHVHYTDVADIRPDGPQRRTCGKPGKPRCKMSSAAHEGMNASGRQSTRCPFGMRWESARLQHGRGTSDVEGCLSFPVRTGLCTHRPRPKIALQGNWA